ncbi:MAG: hypothetical protein UX10_C0009G0006 [Candidatus Magasanikbacteria bacterium GW2011_GWA2_45_39]|uniref:Uncharacterized protein n=2 Tax=Candidatus Magasanikiibacteriota TaxID=1752731 RepID=A0A0G1QZW0_9BACT|nr:MAG: hypothetical protein UX10_C0009G0006 [Candidatus Magasanikbacteria bacterium GW2011_GWA2_45_39]KKU14180.1 MAG: hypothetical protein UX20_C0004G0007 [Candidatus Magasanikbacteria bacterium GW2011_GWC2_45_8]HBW74026.1 hypothetical protein [Candidatus Magasanikbacteria bacterium]
MPIKKPELKNQETPLEKLGTQSTAHAPEQAPQFEIKKTSQEVVPRHDQEEKSSSSRKPKTAFSAPVAPAPQPKSELLLEVEDILSEDLAPVYQKMTPENQRKFKAKGEEIARTIWQMMETAKLQLKKILTLLREWLKMIPSVNRYFLEQETKIKIDKIIDLTHKQKH